MGSCTWSFPLPLTTTTMALECNKLGSQLVLWRFIAWFIARFKGPKLDLQAWSSVCSSIWRLEFSVLIHKLATGNATILLSSLAENRQTNMHGSWGKYHHTQEFITIRVCNSHMVSIPAIWIEDVDNQWWICLTTYNIRVAINSGPEDQGPGTRGLGTRGLGTRGLGTRGPEDPPSTYSL